MESSRLQTLWARVRAIATGRFGPRASARLHVRLYTRAGCHLCDEALHVLRDHRLDVELVDVDGDPKLVERYGEVVPVVEINRRERFRGQVEPVLLRRIVCQERG